ncbi:extracellular solute-binding protein [Lachnospiraceae bacterium OttesenSCG-928-D06]|nr:extracellular solute-binding protein [Lachnospiraceae bacterium OttesenSCG-928-D06]
MKKPLVKLLTLLFVGTMLTGCAGGSTPSANTEEKTTDNVVESQKESSEAASDEKITLRFAWWGGDERTAATLEVIEQFEAIYPNVTIEAEYGGSDGYHDKLSTQLAAGTAADIIQVDPETFPTYVYGGSDYFINYMDDDFDLSNFDEAYISLPINGRYDGRQLGLPSGIAGPMMLVNQDLADAIGIDFTKDYTWEDLIAWGKMVREYDDSMYLLGTNKDYITNLVVYNYAKQLTGTTIFDKENNSINLTEEQLYEVFLLVERLYKEEVVAPASYSAAYTGDSLQSDPNWIGGKYVSTLSYISTMDVMIAANENATYSVGNLPVMEGAKDNGWTANCPQVFAVTATCEHQEMAVAFMDYFFNNETAMETLACTRSVPPTAKAREICEGNGSLSSLAMDAANVASGMGGITPDSIASSQEGKQIITDAVEMIGYGASSPEDVASSTINLLKGLLD